MSSVHYLFKRDDQESSKAMMSLSIEVANIIDATSQLARLEEQILRHVEMMIEEISYLETCESNIAIRRKLSGRRTELLSAFRKLEETTKQLPMVHNQLVSELERFGI